MTESAYRVETTSRLAQWRIETLSSCTYRKSDPFRIGLWNWFLTVEKNKQVIIKLFPEASSLTRDRPPVASFVIRIICAAGRRRHILHPEVRDRQIKTNDDFVWAIETMFTGKFIIDVEFIDLKAAPPLGGGEPSSIWAEDQLPETAAEKALAALRQMLAGGINTDVTITAADGGGAAAHRAVLAARSPVFHSMFSHDLKEKELAVVEIADMSSAACWAFLRYLYGGVPAEEFAAHRFSLLRAADKYDVADLRKACEESLCDDISGDNVLERLQMAHLYRLPLLKGSCMRYLVNFGRICDLHEEFNSFLMNADRELIGEIFFDVLEAWKGH